MCMCRCGLECRCRYVHWCNTRFICKCKMSCLSVQYLGKKVPSTVGEEGKPRIPQ